MELKEGTKDIKVVRGKLVGWDYTNGNELYYTDSSTGIKETFNFERFSAQTTVIVRYPVEQEFVAIQIDTPETTVVYRAGSDTNALVERLKWQLMYLNPKDVSKLLFNRFKEACDNSEELSFIDALDYMHKQLLADKCDTGFIDDDVSLIEYLTEKDNLTHMRNISNSILKLIPDNTRDKYSVCDLIAVLEYAEEKLCSVLTKEEILNQYMLYITNEEISAMESTDRLVESMDDFLKKCYKGILTKEFLFELGRDMKSVPNSSISKASGSADLTNIFINVGLM